MKAMADELHDMGIKVTIWTHPFHNIESKILQQTLPSVSFTDYEYSDNAYEFYVRAGHPYNKQPGLIKWWNGYGCHLGEVFNSQALKLYRGLE